jgi:uncharacterized protein YjbI with pentapeptide repeats
MEVEVEMSERIKRLFESINQSAQHISAATLTFLAVCVYIGIAVSSTNDEVLLLGTSIGLPLFDVQVRLASFYSMAPALLVVLHLHLLLLLYLLACKVVAYVKAPNLPDEETDLFFPALLISVLRRHGHTRTIRFLLGLLFSVTLLLPVGLLVLIQIQFLAYHSPLITAWHKILVLIDLALIWYFFITRPPVEEENGEIGTQVGVRRPFKAEIYLFALTLVALFSSTFIAGDSLGASSLYAGHPDWLPKWEWFNDNLSLPERLLVGQFTSERDLSSETVRGVQLADRDLRGAHFSGAILINADFRGSDLTGADFQGADLRGAKFSPLTGASELREELQDALAGIPNELDEKRAKALRQVVTSLRRVNLRGAKLQGANLLMADLRGADLDQATLDYADLSLADLRGAHLHKASLRGAKLLKVLFNASDLRQADLRLADLRMARFIGSDLRGALLLAADLSNADLTWAKLIEVDAAVANLALANLLGADFRYAKLHSSIGLNLQGVDLRGANLGASDLCTKFGSSKIEPDKLFSDIRLIEFTDYSEEEWSRISIEPKDDLLLSQQILAKIQDRKGAPCWNIQDDLNRPKGFLYSSSGRPSLMKKWPKPQLTERAYNEKLAKMLVRSICGSRTHIEGYEVVNGLLRDLAGDLVPQRPLLSLALARELSGRFDDLQALEKALADVRDLSKALDSVGLLTNAESLEYLKHIEILSEVEIPEGADGLRDTLRRARDQRRNDVEESKLSVSCPSLRLLSEEQRASIKRATKEDPLRTDSEPVDELRPQ